MYHSSSPQATSSYAVNQPSAIQSRLRLPVTASLPNLRRDQKQGPDSRPMVSQPSSPSLVNASSPAALQNHIYAAFLDRRTADVALHVHGSWHAIYKLHRVVLIQAVSSIAICSPFPPRMNALRFVCPIMVVESALTQNCHS